MLVNVIEKSQFRLIVGAWHEKNSGEASPYTNNNLIEDMLIDCLHVPSEKLSLPVKVVSKGLFHTKVSVVSKWWILKLKRMPVVVVDDATMLESD